MRLPFATICVLVLLAGNTSRAQIKTVWASPKHDEKGNLLPLQPYGETIDRGMKFILEDLPHWAKGNTITDEIGKIRHVYFFYSYAVDGQQVGKSSYPAGHHAIFIHSFLNYYVYSGNREALQRAEELAEWNLRHSTPVAWKYGGLPYSTVHNGRVGGGVDGDAIMTDKPAVMAGAYLRLYRMTQKRDYLLAAERIAVTLANRQLPEGNWSFRVNPKTGDVREAYTSSVIYAVELFERLDALTKREKFAEAKAKALKWLLTGPVQTGNWNGFYEDVGKSPTNRTNFDCIDTACWLIRHRAEDKEYLPLAMKLYEWVKRTFVDEKWRYSPACGVREQLVCNFRMSGHSVHWAILLGHLYEATGDDKYLADLCNVASLITYHLQPDNHIALGPEWDETVGGHWYSNQFTCVRWLIDLLGYAPMLAPDGEDHLLRATAAVQMIEYGPKSVTYVTDGGSSDVLKLSFAPSKITVNETSLLGGDGISKGWNFDAQTKILRLVHDAGKVIIR